MGTSAVAILHLVVYQRAQMVVQVMPRIFVQAPAHPGMVIAIDVVRRRRRAKSIGGREKIHCHCKNFSGVNLWRLGRLHPIAGRAVYEAKSLRNKRSQHQQGVTFPCLNLFRINTVG